MRVIAVLFCVLLSSLGATVGAQPQLEILPAGAVKPRGWIQRQMQLDLEQGLTGKYHQVSNAVNLSVFERQNRPAGGLVDIPGENQQKSWWSGEHEGYWKDSIVRMAFLVDDQDQKQRVHDWMKALLEAQDEDGYIGVYSRETRFPTTGENGELWTQSRIFQAMLAYYEFTGDQRILSAVQRAVQLSLAKYRDRTYFGAEGGAGGLSHGVGYIDTLEWLYRITDAPVYRDGAIWLYQDYQKLESRDRDMQLAALLDADRRWQEHTPHIMEGLHMPAILYGLTGESIYGEAAAAALAKFDQHVNPGGGVVGSESVNGRLGSADMPSEYCTMTEGVSSLNRMLAWQGDLAIGTRVERVCLNAAQGARFQPVNRAVRYLTSDNQRTADQHHHRRRYLYSAWHDAAACCTLNSGRLMPYYVEGMWYRDPEHDALVANLYGPCHVTTSIKDTSIKLEEDTIYPFSDRIEFRVDPETPLRFALVLRIPPCAGRGQVERRAGARIERFEDRIEITNTWRPGESFVVDFNFTVRRLQDRNDEFYHQWGPLVFALPLPEERQAVREFAALDGRKSGFHMWEIRPTSEDAWHFHLRRASQFTLVQPSDGDPQLPWAHPTVGLKGTLLNAQKRPVSVVLKPLGCALLRRTTFPLAE